MKRRLHLWLIAHGLEFEYGKPGWVSSFHRFFSIVINHRYYTVAFSFELSRGAYTDELHTPHAEIAAERAQHD